MKTWLALLVCCGCPHHATDPRLPLELVADVPLPGGATRFDYQDLDADRALLVIAHMNDGTVLIVDLDGAVKAEIPNVPTARGVAVATELGGCSSRARPIRSWRSTSTRSQR